MYPPHHFGGYELVWRSAMEHLRAEGHQVRVLTTDLRTASALPDDPGVHRELRWYWRDHGFPRRRLRATVAIERHDHAVLARHLKEMRSDVVSWWAMGGMPLSLLEAVRRRGLPAVAFVHDDWLDYGRHVDGWLRRFGGRKAVAAPLAERLLGLPARVDFAAAAHYVFVSESTRRRAGFDGDVAHSGIHSDFLAPAPEREWAWRLLYVGRLDERKGVDTAIEALAYLPAAARLAIVGGWDEREEARLRALAGGLGVAERVEFRGQRERPELLAAYAEADAVVFPVRWEEPWGLVPLEAMGAGRPVVATGRGGSGEYLRDGENALLFEPGDPRALAAALSRLAADPALRSALRERGRETAALHTEPRFNAEVLRQLEARASRRRPRAGPSTSRR
jgi:glycosyltransferase involved in cell wall biosynthesis